MPAIMALEGPKNLGAVRVTLGPRGRNVATSTLGPVAGPLGLVMRGRGGATHTLMGVTDTIKAHPWAIVAGILFGAYALTKGWSPGMIWGGHQAAHARNKSLHGRRRR
jgi:hypothetical protein